MFYSFDYNRSAVFVEMSTVLGQWLQMRPRNSHITESVFV